MLNHTKVDERISLTHDYWIDPDSRDIWIHGVDVSGIDYEGVEPGVEYLMATRVIKNLHYLRKQSTRKSVTIHLHTCGGDYQEGLAIYDTIKLMPYPVTIISYTHARSMSSMILQAAAGPHDTRLLMPNSYFMFHYGELGSAGNAKDVYSEVEFSKRQDQIMIDIYIDAIKNAIKFKGKTDKQLQKILTDIMDKKGDVFLTAKEAIEWGFADDIVESWPSHSKWTIKKE